MIVHVQRKECYFGAHHVIEYLDIKKNPLYTFVCTLYVIQISDRVYNVTFPA
jgi:hypothetical protein